MNGSDSLRQCSQLSVKFQAILFQFLFEFLRSSMASAMDKRDLHSLSADITQLWDESVNFEPDFVEHDALPLAVRIDLQRKICQKVRTSKLIKYFPLVFVK